MYIHLADISNPTKPWKLCYKWIDLLFVEFFHQGDKEREKGVPVSYLMDRYTTNIAAAQGGFIDGFIRPAYDLLHQILPEVIANIKQMDENKIQWKALEEDYAPENKFTQKEIQNERIEESQSDNHEEEEEEYSDDPEMENSSNEAHKLAGNNARGKQQKYTMNSSPGKNENTSSFS